MRDLAFYIRGIEAGMIAALKSAVGLGDPDQGFAENGYVKMIKGYDGEMNAGALRAAISKIATSFPLMFVSYVNGKDDRAAWDSGLPNEPVTMGRDCRFAVVVATNDARGTEARRAGAAGNPGVYQMEADAVTALGGKLIAVQVPAEEEAEVIETVYLTLRPLLPAGDSPIMQLPNVTAFAQYFDTYFEYELPDRRGEPITIDQINFGISPLDRSQAGDGAPGVH
jgi:hypothetical protein